ncbi:hypothetical protein SAMN05444166_4043 [Singulisphaera sp. GP187]|uniref:hypothetical protein n=1 Tax=Singulisphaera sp. GP187 TaxID=1882752 RepID=UPI0009289B2A|nr:hypothetical protein [Singulisphaera sp. GP187]SIO35530.1 hypothetical protein SAMN05444166_4043 [Singulisphaera sp. GP187]
MFSFILAAFTIGLGLKAFTPAGLPLNSKKNLTGVPAKVIGIVCVLLGVALIVDGVFGTMRLVSLGTGR